MNPQAKKQLAPPPPSAGQVFLRAGLPFLLFVSLSSYVLSSAIEGKNKERDMSKGGSKMSKSERQYKMEKEKDEMMTKLQKNLKKDFDNTKRIERPEEILARRKKEREQAKVWYRRLGRWWNANT